MSEPGGLDAPLAPDGRPRDAAQGSVRCETCPRRCILPPDALGACRARRNAGVRVVADNYGRITSLALDHVEKKPLRRWHPGSLVVSVGSYGCNMRCPFCQNHQISQAGEHDVAWRELTCEDLVDAALAQRELNPSVVGIAYTYNEPLVGWEYVRDCSRLAHESGLANVLVSNGCASPGVIRELAPLIDAANIDLKSFSRRFYQSCGGELGCVRHTISALAALETCHLEVTTLVIPGENDSAQEVGAIAAWLASLDPSIPYHVTRFLPCWRMTDRSPTRPATVYALADHARHWLDHVYVGNC